MASVIRYGKYFINCPLSPTIAALNQPTPLYRLSSTVLSPPTFYCVFTSPSASTASTCSFASSVCTVPSSNVTLHTAH